MSPLQEKGFDFAKPNLKLVTTKSLSDMISQMVEKKLNNWNQEGYEGVMILLLRLCFDRIKKNMET